jgi:hypothetical protein
MWESRERQEAARPQFFDEVLRCGLEERSSAVSKLKIKIETLIIITLVVIESQATV